jgi:hypothetical protein
MYGAVKIEPHSVFVLFRYQYHEGLYSPNRITMFAQFYIGQSQ